MCAAKGKKLEGMELIEAIEKNIVELGVKVVDINRVEGNIKTDKNGQVIVDETTGEPLKWNDSYYAKLAFSGGEMNVKVNSDVYDLMDVGKRYLAKGRVFIKTPYGDGKPYPSFELTQFEQLV